MSRFANGLALVMAASRELIPRDAAAQFPEEMPLLVSELGQFTTWILDFEDVFRERYGAGNDAGLRATVMTNSAPNPTKVRCGACVRYDTCPYSSCPGGPSMTAVHSDTATSGPRPCAAS